MHVKTNIDFDSSPLYSSNNTITVASNVMFHVKQCRDARQEELAILMSMTTVMMHHIHLISRHSLLMFMWDALNHMVGHHHRILLQLKEELGCRVVILHVKTAILIHLHNAVDRFHAIGSCGTLAESNINGSLNLGSNLFDLIDLIGCIGLSMLIELIALKKCNRPTGSN